MAWRAWDFGFFRVVFLIKFFFFFFFGGGFRVKG